MKDILLEWRKYITEAGDPTLPSTSITTTPATTTTSPVATDTTQEDKEKKQADARNKLNSLTASLNAIQKQAAELQALLTEKKKKSGGGDRCTRIAKRKYKVWPSAYASGAVVKCRQGKIWKGISENATDEEIDELLLLENIQVIEEKWSEKYKRSIDCKNPKGFSQKAHCQGKKKNEEINLDSEIIDEELDEAKKRDYKPNFSKEKEQGLHGWFARNKGKGWINCRTGGPCGRSSADKKGGKYPACRPTKAQCKSAGKGPLRRKKSSKPISWTKKKKKD